MGTALKIIFKILTTLILMPLYGIVSLLVMIMAAVGSVILTVGGFLSFIVIFFTLVDMISTGNVKGDIPQLVLGALLVVIPAVFMAFLDSVHEAFEKALVFIAGI